MGLYMGHQARQQGAREKLLDKFVEEIEQNGALESLLVELCDSDAERGAGSSIGIVASTNGDFAFVQDATA